MVSSSALSYLKWQSWLFSFVRFFNITISLCLSLPFYRRLEKHIKTSSILHEDLHSWDTCIANFSEWIACKLLQKTKTKLKKTPKNQLPNTSDFLLSETILFSTYSPWSADKHHTAIKFLHIVLHVYRKLHFWWGFQLVQHMHICWLVFCMHQKFPQSLPGETGCHHSNSF